MNVFIQYLKYVGIVSIPIIVGAIIILTVALALYKSVWFWLLFFIEIIFVIGFVFWVLDVNSNDPLFPYKEYNFKRKKGDK